MVVVSLSSIHVCFIKIAGAFFLYSLLLSLQAFMWILINSLNLTVSYKDEYHFKNQALIFAF